jgi:crossover junction endodeoxyribonuclease RuvC
MRILGVDPGLKATGYGLIEANHLKVALIETGTIEPKRQYIFEKRIQVVYDNLQALIQEYHPEVLVLEKIYAHTKHPATASIMGHVRGAICLLCAQNNIDLAEHSAKRIRKAVCGNGNAPKGQIQRVVARALGIPAEQLTLDASDALALALGYVHINRVF